MPAPFIGRAEKVNLAIGGNQDEVLERVTLFLAAVVEALFVRITRSVNRPFRSIVEKRDRWSGATSGIASSSVSSSAAVR